MSNAKRRQRWQNHFSTTTFVAKFSCWDFHTFSANFSAFRKYGENHQHLNVTFWCIPISRWRHHISTTCYSHAPKMSSSSVKLRHLPTGQPGNQLDGMYSLRGGLGDHRPPKTWHCQNYVAPPPPTPPPNPGILANMVHKSARMRLGDIFQQKCVNHFWEWKC